MKRLRKNNDQIIDGVCGGIAKYLGDVDPIWIRLAFVLGSKYLLLPYIVLIFLMPEPEDE